MTLWMYLSIFRCNFAIKAAENILSCQVSEMELWRSLSQLIWAELLNAALWLAELRAAPPDRLGGLGRRQESLRGALMLFFLRPPSRVPQNSPVWCRTAAKVDGEWKRAEGHLQRSKPSEVQEEKHFKEGFFLFFINFWSAGAGAVRSWIEMKHTRINKSNHVKEDLYLRS